MILLLSGNWRYKPRAYVRTSNNFLMVVSINDAYKVTVQTRDVNIGGTKKKSFFSFFLKTAFLKLLIYISG